MSAWVDAIDVARPHRTYIFVGAGRTWLDALRARDIDVSCHVDTEPMAPMGAAPTHVPTLHLSSGAGGSPSPLGADWSAMADRTPCVRAFLDEHDPDRSATVLSLLAVPRAIAGGRPIWAPDVGLACQLESKAPIGAALASVVPWVASEPMPERADAAWFREVTRRHAVTSVAVQRVGLSWYGEGTWRCHSADEVAAVMRRCGEVRITPWLDGTSVNSTGAVSQDGQVLTMPSSLQLIAPDADGRPLYWGNVLGPRDPAVESVLRGHARAAGHALAALGYIGMFGLDGILAAGEVRYHDLNPRVNGALVAHDLLAPVMVGTMLLSAWASPERVGAVEAELDHLVRRRPAARWRLAEVMTSAGVMGHVPRPGVYRLDPFGPTLQLAHADGERAAELLRDDLVLIRPRSAPSTLVRASERAPLADLWCTRSTNDSLIEAHGDRAGDRLVAACRAVGSG